MASIRQRGNSYLLVISMGYDYQGNRIKAQQKTVKPPEMITPKQIEKWLKEQAILFEKQVKNQPITYLFRQENKDLPMLPDSFSHRFKKILKANGLPEKLNIHSLRHSVASVLIANGTDVTTVASLLGHSQVSTTLDIYSHAFDKNRKKASEVLQKGLGV